MMRPEATNRPPDHVEARDAIRRSEMLPAWLGVGIVSLGHAVVAFVMGSDALPFIGMAQFIYVLPVLIAAAVSEERQVERSVAVSAIITFYASAVFLTHALLALFSR